MALTWGVDGSDCVQKLEIERWQPDELRGAGRQGAFKMRLINASWSHQSSWHSASPAVESALHMLAYPLWSPMTTMTAWSCGEVELILDRKPVKPDTDWLIKDPSRPTLPAFA